jgi:hypothetical protein
VRAAVGEQQRKWLEAVPTLKTPSSHPSYAALGQNFGGRSLKTRSGTIIHFEVVARAYR